MKFILFLCTFIILYLCFERIISPRLTDAHCQRLLSDGSIGAQEIPSRLITATFPDRQVINSLSLPIPGREGEEIHIGTVAVNRSGIYIICRICGDGIIENPPDKPRWNYITNGQSREFDNPFRSHAGARELIEYYAKNAGLGYAKCHSLIIYSGSNLKFTYPKSRQLIPAESLNRRFRMLDKMGKLNRDEVFDICKLLSDINQGADC